MFSPTCLRKTKVKGIKVWRRKKRSASAVKLLDIKHIFEIQRNFDRQLGWNTYENCKTPEEIADFVEHFVVVMVEELGELSRARKRFLRDNQGLDMDALRQELVDIFVYFTQACMALNMDLEKEFLRKKKLDEGRFPRKR
jgi:NTP pyrophosphatase (non-canonical NTP hydrolase)